MRTLIEDCFALSTHLIKKDLKKAREKQLVEGEFLNFRDNGRGSALDYSIEYGIDGNTYLIIKLYAEIQRILLSEHPLRFGTRSYLTCDCGRRCNALYLKQGYFACRSCQRLRYKSTVINTTSEHGHFLKLQAQRVRLMDLREKIDRPMYKGRWTKRFRHWLGLCSKWGAFDQVIKAWEAQEAIKGN